MLVADQLEDLLPVRTTPVRERAQVREHIVVVAMEVYVHRHPKKEITQVVLLVGTGNIGTIVKDARVVRFLDPFEASEFDRTVEFEISYRAAALQTTQMPPARD